MAKDHQGQVENILRELGKKIDDLIIEAKSATGEVREDLEETIKDFKEKRAKMEDEYQEFKQKNEGKWEEIKSHLSAAALEMEKAAKAAFKSSKE